MRGAWLLVLAGCAPVDAVDLAVPVEARVEPGVLQGATAEVSDLRLHWPVSAGLPSPIGVAWAHPGHGSSGDVGAELLGRWTVQSATDLGDASAWAGRYATASLHLHTAWLTVDGDTVEVPVDTRIEGIPAGLALHRGDALRLTLHADGALSELPPELSPTDPEALDALRFGLLSTRAWSLEVL